MKENRNETYSVEIIDEGASIALFRGDEQIRFHAFWLRDNALDAGSRDPRNGQRLISVLDLDGAVCVSDARIENEDTLKVTMQPGQESLSFPLEWLTAHRYDGRDSANKGWLPDRVVLWDSEHEQNLPIADYDDVRHRDDALRSWLDAIARYGIARLRGVPCNEGAVCDVAALFGYVRETNYGRWFDVRTKQEPNNLAYTGLGLLAHTDNPYRDPVPTLQLLACLENSAEGGESIVVDGFAAARRLQSESERHFDLLSRYCARFDFSGSADVCLRSRRPLIELAPDGELICIRFNNRSVAPIVDVPYEEMQDYYAAYRHLAEIIESEDSRVRFRLEPGELFIVDNTRVLHARDAFSGAGTRWLQGCYADKDSLLSTLAVLSAREANK